MSSADSASATSATVGRVLGWRGVKTVQQSSYGRMDVSNVPISRAIFTISRLSMPMSGWSTGRCVTSCVQAMASMVWLATWPRFSPVMMSVKYSSGQARRISS